MNLSTNSWKVNTYGLASMWFEPIRTDLNRNLTEQVVGISTVHRWPIIHWILDYRRYLRHKTILMEIIYWLQSAWFLPFKWQLESQFKSIGLKPAVTTGNRLSSKVFRSKHWIWTKFSSRIFKGTQSTCEFFVFIFLSPHWACALGSTGELPHTLSD